MQSPGQLQTSFFRLPQGTRHEQQQQQQQQSVSERRVTQTANSYFRTQPRMLNQTQQAGPRQEERVREGLGYAPALAKLKQEADKIRKWKTATQFELKKKEGQLCEASEQLRAQQEALTGLRVREEGLKTRLLDQLASHKEIQQKILVTRGLCSALKERVEYADATLGQGRADHKDNVDLDRLRLEQYRALADKFSQLEQEQGEVQRSLEEALMRERERGRGLEEELTDERGRSGQLTGECASLRDQLTEARAEASSVRSHLEAVEVRLKQEEGERGRAEEECRHLRQQLTVSQDHSVSLQTTVTSLNEQLSTLRSEYSQSESSHCEELAARAEQCHKLQSEAEAHCLTIDSLQSQLTTAGREREDMEMALASLREELCAMEHSRRDDVAGLQAELRAREQSHAHSTAALQTTAASLHASLAALQTQLTEIEADCKTKDQELVRLSLSLEDKEAVSVSLRAEVEGLQGNVEELEREGEERRAEREREMEAKDQELTQLSLALRDKEAVSISLKSEVESLQGLVNELEREGKEGRGEREREREEAQTTISSLSTELEALRRQLDHQHKTEGERVQQLQREKEEVEKEVGEVRQQLADSAQLRQQEQRAAEAAQAELRRETAAETQQCRQDADSARDSQLREKESFDAQVTELCGMLEKYRTENNKIVQQRDVQIHNLQTSLADTSKAKESLEEMVRVAQEEVLRVGEESGRLQQALQDREARVKEKEAEITDLLKAVDTLRSKQSGPCASQSTTHTSCTPLHSPLPHSHSSPPAPAQQTLSPHTPQVPVVSSMAPLTAPVPSSLHSIKQLKTPARSVYGYRVGSHSVSRTRPALMRPVVKKPRYEEEGEEGGGVVSYEQADQEEIVFRRPRPLQRQSEPSSSYTSSIPTHTSHNTTTTHNSGCRGSYEVGESSASEVSSTVSRPSTDRRGKAATTRVRGGRGRKAGGTRERKGTGGGGERGAGRKQPGTAWFDLDAVFGFGPED